ncbi:hypothetical protein SAMN05892883_0282 [Jatrophihabitans sp. GAS493]|uniref:glycosyltransferase n=1 Tax=Jatrophihabitans sp. GAS493 TaxID=1907575 RepID=UPI000BB9929B|nr:glycosyltransferase [Jatrophihabitans sp. GAS493]SOD70601.1 hypothetical protein SAMN05892883_0282 [Jatrophihabitans sp. GAS493]
MSIPASSSPAVRTGVVSVVIVNYRGPADTNECLSRLGDLNWPTERLEVIVVDNNSGDDSVPLIRSAHPDILLIESEKNTGFAGGCNLGIKHASGEFVALINSDAKPDRDWLSEAVRTLSLDQTVGAVACKVLDWDGTHVDYVGGNVNFLGQGYKLEAEEPDSQAYNTPRDVLFSTGSATVFRTSVFREVGGFDERFFMFFEDVDLGWRLNMLGYRVRYVPTSLVYHKHHAAIAKFANYRERYLLERNGLLMVYKNLDGPGLERALAPALLMTLHNAMLLGGEDNSALDLEVNPVGDDEPNLSVNKLTMSAVHAIDYLATNLEEIEAERVEIQSRRVVSDMAIPGLVSGLLQSTYGLPGFHRRWLAATEIFGLNDMWARRRRVAIVTADTLADRMAGPAIRALHIAEELSHENDVKLVSTTRCDLTREGIECLFANDMQLRQIVDWCDIVVYQGFVVAVAPWIADTDKVLVVDIYDPMHLEQLEQTKNEPGDRDAVIEGTTNVINRDLARGDFFMCASEEQRHFWLGQLAGVGRLNPRNYDRDSSLASLLAVCPFGLSATDPIHTRPALRGVVPGISVTDKVIIWAGGVYNWFDPITLIKAVDRLRHEHADVRLFFLGMKHPNPNVPEMSMAWDARTLSDDLGLTGKFVFFNEDWVDYDDRQNYLLEADVGVSTHMLHVETTFSFRTRMLDYLWAGLPMVATGGDAFGRMIVAEGLGVAVDERDVDGLAEALERALFDEEFVAACRANVARVRVNFHWDRTLAPLVQFCRQASRAADFGIVAAKRRGLTRSPSLSSAGPVARNLHYARQRYSEGGVRGMVNFGVAKARRLAKSGVDKA